MPEMIWAQVHSERKRKQEQLWNAFSSLSPSSWCFNFQLCSFTDSEGMLWVASLFYDLPPSPSPFPCGEGQVLHSKNTIIRSAAQCQISEVVNSISSPPPVVEWNVRMGTISPEPVEQAAVSVEMSQRHRCGTGDWQMIWSVHKGNGVWCMQFEDVYFNHISHISCVVHLVFLAHQSQIVCISALYCLYLLLTLLWLSSLLSIMHFSHVLHVSLLLYVRKLITYWNTACNMIFLHSVHQCQCHCAVSSLFKPSYHLCNPRVRA